MSGEAVMVDEESKPTAAEIEARAALAEQDADRERRVALLAETKEKYPEEYAAVMDAKLLREMREQRQMKIDHHYPEMESEELILAPPPATAFVPTLETLDKRFYKVENFGGSVVVCEEDERTGQLMVQKVREFKLRYSNYKIKATVPKIVKGKTADVEVSIPISTAWLEYYKHPSYESVEFAPEQYLGVRKKNLWKGFAVEPIKGDCTLYLNHLRDNICKGDPEKYNWLLCWMAWKVRNPGVKSYSAVVLRGGEGIGKNVAFNGFGDLFGRYSLTVTQKEHVSGHFNAHLRTCCVLCANEAFYAGDKQHESTLKGLITDDEFMIEAKGVDPTKERNRISVFILSNESWVVPASVGARRFTVFDCGSDRVQDTEYFGAIVDQLKNGGSAALLYHFKYEVDISNFDERKILVTKALADQQAHSLRNVENLWFECLVRGRLPFSDPNCTFLKSDALLEWSRGQNQREWRGIAEANIGLLLSKNPRGDFKGMDFPKTRVNNRRGWVIPSLKECRELWNKLRFQHDWEDLETSEWEHT